MSQLNLFAARPRPTSPIPTGLGLELELARMQRPAGSKDPQVVSAPVPDRAATVRGDLFDQRPRAAALELIRSSSAGSHAPATDLERLVEAFLLSSIENPHTERAYRRHIMAALGMIGGIELADVSIGDLLAIRAALIRSDLAPASQTAMIFALRSFLTWLHEIGMRLPFALDHARAVLKAPKAITLSSPAILTEEEATRAFGRASEGNGMYAMLAVLLGGGLRVEELCKLDVGDLIVDEKGEGAVRVRGKGRKDRLVPLHAPVVAAVVRYLGATGRSGGGAAVPLFWAHDATSRARGLIRRIGVRSARKRVNRLMVSAAIAKDVRVHGLRRTFATRVIKNGGSLLHLGELLGHARLATTERYVATIGLRLGELRAAIPTDIVP
jgi:integrase/recombinase XerC